MLVITGHKGGFILDYSESDLSLDRRSQTILTRLLHGANDPDTRTIRFESQDAFQSVSTLQKAIDRLGIKEEIKGDERTDSIISKAHEEQENFDKFSAQAKHIRDNEYDVGDLKDFETSVSTMKRPLKSFQLLAAYHLTYAQNAANFSVPGAGKTATVLAAYNYLRQTPDNRKRTEVLVVVCPLAAFKAWKDEYKTCFGYEPEMLEIFGGTKVGKGALKNALLASDSRYDMILVGYQSLASYEVELTHFIRNNPAMLVLDEAHRIKKVDTGLWAEAVLRLAPLGRSRIVLTGTPAPNGYIDLRNLFKFMWPERDIIGYSNAQLKQMDQLPSDDRRIKDLSERLAPFFIRVDKKHLKLPPATFHDPTKVTMGPLQQRIYGAIENAYIPQLSEVKGANIGLFKSRLIRLRQAASNPMLLTRTLQNYYASQDIDEGQLIYGLTDDLGVSPDILSTISSYKKYEVPAKFKALRALVEGIIKDGGKIIVWCEFVSNLLEAGAFLEDAGIKVEYLYGAVCKDDRERIIDEFHDPASPFRVILANPHAVGESISLHLACHNAVYFEMGYNAAAYMQSKDRIHRVGLPEDARTDYYFLVSKDTIDIPIHERVIEKERKMIELIEGQEIPLLTNNFDFMEDDSDDLKLLLKDYYERHGLV